GVDRRAHPGSRPDNRRALRPPGGDAGDRGDRAPRTPSQRVARHRRHVLAHSCRGRAGHRRASSAHVSVDRPGARRDGNATPGWIAGAARGRHRPPGAPVRHHRTLHAPAQRPPADARHPGTVHRRSDRADDDTSGGRRAQHQADVTADESGHVPERRRSVRKDPTGLGRRLAVAGGGVCCGGGGVGKTTVSAALGIAIAAAEDKRVLVLTVDPARRLATALGIKGIGAEPVRIPKARLRRAGISVTGDLEAAMLDMKQAWDRMIERYSPDRATAQRILRNPLYQRITDSFVGSHEYAAIEALYELHDAGEYDCIVVDTPPSRNALDFLEAPTRLTDYVGSRLLSLLSGGPSRFGFRAMNYAAAPFLRLADRLLGAEVLAEVSDFVRQLQTLYDGIQGRARSVYRLLRSPQTGVVVVATLEQGPFSAAEFFCPKLREFT